MQANKIRLYGYSILPLMIKKTSVRCLNCNAEVSAKVKSDLVGAKQFFFLFSINRT